VCQRRCRCIAEVPRFQEFSSDLQRLLNAEKPACVVMTDVEAALASAWIAQIGSKSVTVTGVPAHVASGVLPLSCVVRISLTHPKPPGIPFSIRIWAADFSKRPVSLESVPPPPPDDTVAPSIIAEACNHHHSCTTPSMALQACLAAGGAINVEARRVFFCDTFEGALKWSCPPPSALISSEEPPPALRFDLRPLPSVDDNPHDRPRCLCVNGGFPNAKVDRNWVGVTPHCMS
jgi:hypothetical protein